MASLWERSSIALGQGEGQPRRRSRSCKTPLRARGRRGWAPPGNARRAARSATRCLSVGAEGKTSISQIMGAMGASGGPGQLLDAFTGFALLSGYPDYLRMMNEQVKMAKLKDVEREEAFRKVDEEPALKRTSVLVRLMMPATFRVAEARRNVLKPSCVVPPSPSPPSSVSAQARSMARGHKGPYSRRFNQGRLS